MKILVSSSDVFDCDIWIPEEHTEEVLGVFARRGSASMPDGYVTEKRMAGGISHELETLGVEVVVIENQEEPDGEQEGEVADAGVGSDLGGTHLRRAL